MLSSPVIGISRALKITGLTKLMLSDHPYVFDVFKGHDQCTESVFKMLEEKTTLY